MYQRLTARASLTAAAILLTCAVAPLAAQAPAGGKATGPASASGWRTPRTPWGDPDLQGNYTNLYEQGTPLERPKEFEGRTLDQVRGEELAKIKAQVQERTINNFEGPIHAPSNWWQDALDLKRGNQAWLITDPPDGHIPELTPEGQRRATAARRTIYDGGSDSWEDRSLYDRCITRGIPGSMMPAI